MGSATDAIKLDRLNVIMAGGASSKKRELSCVLARSELLVVAK